MKNENEVLKKGKVNTGSVFLYVFGYIMHRCIIQKGKNFITLHA